MKAKINERERKKAAASAAASARYNKSPSPQRKSPSPAKAAASPTINRKRAAPLCDSDESSDDNDDFLAVSRAKLEERRKAEEEKIRIEREACRKHNPLAMERREREEREEMDRRVAVRQAAAQRTIAARRTPAGAGGLEGTEIVLGEENEVKSISDMGDEASRRGSRGEGQSWDWRWWGRGVYYEEAVEGCLQQATWRRWI